MANNNDDDKYTIRCFSKPVEGGVMKTCHINPLLLKALGIELEYVEMPKNIPATNTTDVTLTEQLTVPAEEVTKLAE